MKHIKWLLALGLAILGTAACTPMKDAGLLAPATRANLPKPWVMYDGAFHFTFGTGGSAGFQLWDYITGSTVNFTDSSQTYNGMTSMSITVPAPCCGRNWMEAVFLNQASDYSSGGYTTGTLYVMATGQLSGLKFTAQIFGSAASPTVNLTNSWQKVTCALPASPTNVTIPVELNMFGFTAYPFTVYATDIVVQ